MGSRDRQRMKRIQVETDKEFTSRDGQRIKKVQGRGRDKLSDMGRPASARRGNIGKCKRDGVEKGLAGKMPF